VKGTEVVPGALSSGSASGCETEVGPRLCLCAGSPITLSSHATKEKLSSKFALESCADPATAFREKDQRVFGQNWNSQILSAAQLRRSSLP
jgi:hypothetical protein